MRYYYIQLADHPKSSWVLHEVIKNALRHPRPEGMPPVFYKFFPAPDVEVRLKAVYQGLVCKKCGRYESDEMFEVGFSDPVTVRFIGDYGYTSDRVFSVNEKFLLAIQKARVSGYEAKPLGSSGWFALRVTVHVDHFGKAMSDSGPNCSGCGRPKESWGVIEYLDEISLPSQENTFFTTKKSWPSSFASDRQIFVTEDVVAALKDAETAGGYCIRLWTEEERQKQQEKAKQGTDFWRPPGTLVALSRKRKKGGPRFQAS